MGTFSLCALLKDIHRVIIHLRRPAPPSQFHLSKLTDGPSPIHNIDDIGERGLEHQYFRDHHPTEDGRRDQSGPINGVEPSSRHIFNFGYRDIEQLE